MARAMRHALLAVVTIGAATAAGALQAQEAPRQPDPVLDRVVPVYEEPRHRQVFRSGTTRILELIVLPGDTSLFHSHEDPIVYVNLSSGALRTQELGKDWSQPGGRGGARTGGAGAPAAVPAAPVAPAPAVRVTSTTSYAQTPVTHRITNTGTGIVHALVVVNQTRGTDAITPKDAGFEGMPELANTWYRVYRFALPPGQTGTHTHKVPAFLAQTSDGTAVAQSARLWALNETGDWAFFDAGAAHEIRNTSTATVEFVEIEVRQPAR
jgi:uncharacterized cupin superfamily protein